jgi:uncharacterized protein YlbG (UPF0298 family)
LEENLNYSDNIYNIILSNDHKLFYNPLSQSQEILEYCNNNDIKKLIFDLKKIKLCDPIMLGIFKTLKVFYKRKYNKNLSINIKNPPENFEYYTRNLGYFFKII